MVEPLFRFEGQLVSGQTVLLTGTEGHHAAAVRRMRVGEAIALTDGNGTRGRGQVTEVQPKQISVKLFSVEMQALEHPLFTLVQAVTKGDRDEMAVQATTELGVSRITPWQSNRSISRWDGKEAKNIARWQAIADEAAKQSLRVNFPKVGAVLSTGSLAGCVVDSATSKSVYLVLDPTSTTSITDDAVQARIAAAIEIAVVVGPEGGIEEFELEALEAAGALRVHVGTSILRTSTAGVAAFSYLSGALGKWQ
ncbi:MAG: 16S rRNA (uracil(1498)-N(3))-methyltransferase [Microbacteriaceae bacterium]|nr:16S rRNA (uracil(1498)-N(3))-methyltransferase [Microbacteriaceae bacterium]